jgi:hypothetical protein
VFEVSEHNAKLAYYVCRCQVSEEEFSRGGAECRVVGGALESFDDRKFNQHFELRL